MLSLILHMQLKTISASGKLVLTAMADTHIPLDNVAFIILDVSGQTKVTDLRNMFIRQQDVPRCDVSVDTLKDTFFTLRIFQIVWITCHFNVEFTDSANSTGEEWQTSTNADG